MAATRVGPLNAAVPIVDRFGRPTPEFMAKWLEQNRVNAAIPDVSDAAALSALLDMFGGTQGALLIRGSQRWEELPSPGGTKKFLRADGTYADVTEDELTLSDVDTNDVSTLRHGFVPKLPNDATKYLDGTGQWSTPAGGGGGGTFTVLEFDDGMPPEIVPLDIPPFITAQADPGLGTSNALRFADIANGQETSFQISLSFNRDGTFLVRSKNSSETNFDYMYVYLDNVEQFTTKGNNSFLGMAFVVPAGTHIVKLTYRKDVSGSQNDDTVYISQIQYWESA